MTGELSNLFITLDPATVIQVIVLGFIGGVLSGFIGSGGAFFMTPGMMNLGVNGVVAVASNITHKFGKAMMGSKKHGEMGNVDKRLGLVSARNRRDRHPSGGLDQQPFVSRGG